MAESTAENLDTAYGTGTSAVIIVYLYLFVLFALGISAGSAAAFDQMIDKGLVPSDAILDPLVIETIAAALGLMLVAKVVRWQRDRIDARLDPYAIAFLDWAEPDHVDRAPKRERLKRQVWMVVSTVLSIGTALVVNVITIEVLGISKAVWVVPGLASLLIALYLDLKYLFPWGVERFDLVVPWQFRDEAGGEHDV